MRYAALDRRVVALDDPALLRRALAGVGAVINCAGPFLDTALPLARAAVAAGAHYLDVTAEQAAVQQLYRELDAPARDAGVAVVPAMAFYGGLADLLVTAALDGDSARTRSRSRSASTGGGRPRAPGRPGSATPPPAW